VTTASGAPGRGELLFQVAGSVAYLTEQEYQVVAGMPARERPVRHNSRDRGSGISQLPIPRSSEVASS